MIISKRTQIHALIAATMFIVGAMTVKAQTIDTQCAEFTDMGNSGTSFFTNNCRVVIGVNFYTQSAASACANGVGCSTGNINPHLQAHVVATGKIRWRECHCANDCNHDKWGRWFNN
jgi:hypothetical protein